MKRFLALALALCMVFALCACGTKTETPENSDAGTNAAAALKIGVITIGDETEGYTKAHMDGIEAAKEALGMTDDQIIYMKSIPETAECYDKAVELVETYGCNAIFSNSYGHQTFIKQAAEEYPDVTFVAMTGDFAALTGLDNFKNAFTNIYESRYVSGIVAGMKLQALADAGELTEKNYDADGKVKVGYVGAYNYAEVVSGYTAFYLGLTSVYPEATMYVDYTQSWFDVDKEAAMAEKFIADGCVIIGQHADSTGAPSACQAAWENGTVAYSIGYNVDMLDVAPDAALTSATNNWGVYYTEAFKAIADGTDIETNWAKGYDDGAVAVTTLGKNCAEGTAEAVATAEAAIKDGSLKIFDTSKFTMSAANVEATLNKSGAVVTVDADGHVTGVQVDMSYLDWSTGAPVVVYEGETVEAIVDGVFSESSFRAAPYFTLRIDGINEAA